jgi:23S rRNA (uridine2552-2'-O)-methyltransferase
MSEGKKHSGRGARALKTRVRTARGRTTSSTRWLQRQLNDPYVAAAKRDGYRSRAAYKLLEIDEKYHLLKAGQHVLDLGAAPGGWTQVAVKKTRVLQGRGKVIGIDLSQMEPIAGAHLVQLDFLDQDAPQKILGLLDGNRVDLVMSDMAAPSCGHRQTDHLKIMALCEAAVDFAAEVLNPGGAFLAKVLRGGAETDMLRAMKQSFKTVRHVKPKASRADSAEMYVLATGFRNRAM